MKFVFLSTILLLLTATACTADNEKDLFNNLPCDTTQVQYSTFVAPLIAAQCLQCHSVAAGPIMGNGLVFEGYAPLAQFLQNASPIFLGSIKHQSGFSPMPKNTSRLPNCDLQKIELWIAQGFPNN
jgi:hypothetical protein